MLTLVGKLVYDVDQAEFKLEEGLFISSFGPEAVIDMIDGSCRTYRKQAWLGLAVGLFCLGAAAALHYPVYQRRKMSKILQK